MMNKKGNIFFELLYLLVFVVIIGTIAFPLYELVQEMNVEIQAENEMSVESKETFQSIENNYPEMVDYGFLMLVIFFWIAMLVSSYMIDTYPVFFIILIILIVIMVILVAEFSNMYLEVNAEYGVESFPIMTHIFNNLVLYIITIGFSVGIVMFSKFRGGGQ